MQKYMGEGRIEVPNKVRIEYLRGVNEEGTD